MPDTASVRMSRVGRFHAALGAETFAGCEGRRQSAAQHGRHPGGEEQGTGEPRASVLLRFAQSRPLNATAGSAGVVPSPNRNRPSAAVTGALAGPSAPASPGRRVTPPTVTRAQLAARATNARPSRGPGRCGPRADSPMPSSEAARSRP